MEIVFKSTLYHYLFLKLLYFLFTILGCFAHWCFTCYHCRIGGKFGDGCFSSWCCVFPTTYTSVYRNVKKIEVFTVFVYVYLKVKTKTL